MFILSLDEALMKRVETYFKQADISLFVFDYLIPNHLESYPELLSNFFRAIQFTEIDDIYLIQTKESSEDSFDEDEEDGGDVFNSLRPVRWMIIAGITGEKFIEEVVIKVDVDKYLRFQGRYAFLVTAVSSISFYDVLV